LQGINTTNPCPYNGSAWMLKAGARPDVWSDFSLENYAKLKVPFHAFPDDQGWFWHTLMPDAEAWGPSVGVYGFKKAGLAVGRRSAQNARVVAFPAGATRRSSNISAGSKRTGGCETSCDPSEGLGRS
jgi:hypothetical protein